MVRSRETEERETRIPSWSFHLRERERERGLLSVSFEFPSTESNRIKLRSLASLWSPMLRRLLRLKVVSSSAASIVQAITRTHVSHREEKASWHILIIVRPPWRPATRFRLWFAVKWRQWRCAISQFSTDCRYLRVYSEKSRTVERLFYVRNIV